MSRFPMVSSRVVQARGLRVGWGGSPTPPPAPGALALRGDPAFNENNLSVTQRDRSNRIKFLISDKEGGSRDPWVQANRDDVWWYSHDLQTNLQAYLTAFRITGDLWYLDTIVELSGGNPAIQGMKHHLADAWRDTKDGTDGTTDGFLNWVHRQEASDATYGKDLHLAYDYMAHAPVAQFAYAMHANRDLTSPKGYNYGAEADYWQNFLVNHFEAKHRSRENKPTGFPIRNWPPTNSAYTLWMKWHYYMGKLTSNVAYTNEAVRMSDVLYNQFCHHTTGSGIAYVWRRSNPDIPYGTALYISPTTYAEFVFGTLVDLHLEEFHIWADAVHLQRFARTWTDLIMDTADPMTQDMSNDVGGQVTRCGWQPAHTAGTFRRIDPFWYTNGVFGMLAPWDSTLTMRGLNQDMRAYGDAQSPVQDSARVVAAQMLDTHLNG